MALLTVKEAAERLKVSRATVYQLCESQRLPHVRIGRGRGAIRIEEHDLEAFLDSCKVTTRPALKMALKHIKTRI